MWQRFTAALKPKEAQASQSEIITKVHEQHPNMSMFQPNETGVIEAPPDLPPSPSVHSKKSMFKRMSRNALNDAELRAQLPTAGPPALPPKGKINGNGSQTSLGINATEPRRSQDIPRRSSYDMLRPSPDREKRNYETTRSVKDVRRPSIDFLRQDSNSRPSSPHITEARPSLDFLATPGDKFNSTRSILRDKNTPGTGQNVRFNGNDAFKVITPDNSHSHSLSMEFQNKSQPPLPQDENPFMTRLTEANASADSPQAIGRSQSSNSSGSKSPHPSLGDIFAPLNEQPPATGTPDQSDMSMASFNHFVVEGNSNLFDVSQQLDIPSFPPGLGFDVNSPIFEDSSDKEHNQLLADAGLADYAERFSSTPYRKEDSKGKAKEDPPKDFPVELPTAPKVIDETIFHSQEKSPKLPAPLHERSHSFSAGQTLFYSVGNSGHKSNKSTPDSSAAYPSSDLKPESIQSSPSAPSPSSSSSSKLTRSRAMSDSVFQNMLKAKPTPSPEADINDESSSGLVVYGGGGPAEPDPFSANANTYYTPQTMIPTTPPKGTLIRHNRKTSKEESIIMSLQTELSLKTELCAQFETDLKARDEMMEILNSKLAEYEKEDAKRKAAVRSWKKKVQELERACRLLEEAVEDSRQESMERSIMDEASGEALRMLHRQIASLEREKQDWVKREAGLQEEVHTLETIVKERTEDVQRLNETLDAHDESERELRHGIRAAKEQIDMMGNISLGVIDEEEMRKLLAERDQKSAEDTQRFRTKEFELRQEVEEWRFKYEGLENERRGWEERLEHAENMVRIKEEEMGTLQKELEAQWERTEAESERYAKLVRDRDDVVEERDSIKAGLAELERRMEEIELEWTDSAEKRAELEAALDEAHQVQDALKAQAEELQGKLDEAAEHIELLAQEVEDFESRCAGLEEEQHFAAENVARLQANIKQRDDEISQQTQRVRERQDELEQLREEMSGLRREHNRLLNEQSRALEDVTGQHDLTQAQLEDLVRAKADLEVELKLAKERVQSLQGDNESSQKQLKYLKADSADKEMKIAQLTKQLKELDYDYSQMNIALDAKQQELDLIKRKMGVRGTAGATPAPGSKLPHRRDSSVFSATPASRPESAMSASDTDSTSATIRKKKVSLEGTTGIVSNRVAALANRSNKTNGVASSASSSKLGRPSLDNSMAPPSSMKPRASFSSDTPTPLARSGLSRSSSVTGPSVSPTQMRTPVQHRKVASLSAGEQVKAKMARVPSTPKTVPEELEDEKENVDTTSLANRRRSLVPAS